MRVPSLEYLLSLDDEILSRECQRIVDQRNCGIDIFELDPVLVRKILKETYRPRLINRFIQPFDKYFNNNEYFDREELINFYKNDRKFFSTIVLVKTIFSGNHRDKLVKIIENSNIVDAVCTEALFFFATTENKLKHLMSEKPYLSSLVKFMNTQPYKFVYTIEGVDEEEIKIAPDVNNALPSLFQANNSALLELQQCIENGSRYVFIQIRMINHDTPEIRKLVKIKSDGSSLHSSSIFIDLEKKNAFHLESSISQSSIAHKFERIQNTSLLAFLRKYVDPELKLIEMDMDSCPRVKIQGNSGFCAVWTCYLFLLQMLNSDMTRGDIFTILAGYSQDERNIMLLNFIYYVYKLDLGYNTKNLKYFLAIRSDYKINFN